MALFNLRQLLGEVFKLRRGRHLKGEAKLRIQLTKGATQHRLDFNPGGLRLVQCAP